MPSNVVNTVVQQTVPNFNDISENANLDNDNVVPGVHIEDKEEYVVSNAAFSRSTDTSQYIDISISNEIIRSFLDTGSLLNLIHSKFLYLFSDLRPTNIVLRAVDDRKLSVLGSVELCFVIQNQVFVDDFIVVDDISHDILLGLKFCQKFVASQNFEHNYLVMRDTGLKVPTVKLTDPMCYNLQFTNLESNNINNHLDKFTTSSYQPNNFPFKSKSLFSENDSANHSSFLNSCSVNDDLINVNSSQMAQNSDLMQCKSKLCVDSAALISFMKTNSQELNKLKHGDIFSLVNNFKEISDKSVDTLDLASSVDKQSSPSRISSSSRVARVNFSVESNENVNDKSVDTFDLGTFNIVNSVSAVDSNNFTSSFRVQSSSYDPKSDHLVNSVGVASFMEEITLEPKSNVTLKLYVNSVSDEVENVKLQPSSYITRYPQVVFSKQAIMDRGCVECSFVNNSEDPVTLGSDEPICDVTLDDSGYDDIPRLPDDWLKNYSQADEELLNDLTVYHRTINEGNFSIKLPEIHIDTFPNARPVYSQPYRVSEHKQAVIDAQINDWLAKGIVRPSNSSWASPIVLVPRVLEDGSVKYRCCGNFVRLNQVVQRVNFPLPRSDDLINRFRGAKYFTKIDLLHAYLQLPLAESSMHKTGLISQNHFVEFTKLPFGVSVASQSMQRVMYSLFRKFIHIFLEIFQDDICIFSGSLKEHKRHVRIVLQILASAGLVINIDKCDFYKFSVTYLGMDINGTEIKPAFKNTEVVRAWQTPTNAKMLKYILGHSSYYRNFIKGYSDRVRLLRDLTKKGAKFIWTPEHQKQFDDIKNVLSNPPILTYFDSNRPTFLKTDASDLGLGAVLGQIVDGRECVVAYASTALSNQQSRWSVSEREAFAFVWGIKKFHHFLDGIKFKVIVDHHNLCWLLQNKDIRSKLCRWVVQLQEYDFVVEYKSGRCHLDADCLSRYGYTIPKNHIVSFVSVDTLNKCQQDDITRGVVQLQNK